MTLNHDTYYVKNVDFVYAKMWTFNDVVATQNESGKSYLKYSYPLQKFEFLRIISGIGSSVNVYD
jgi:hypothetical protein